MDQKQLNPFVLEARHEDQISCPGSISRLLKNPPFTLRQAQGERIAVRDELVPLKTLFQQPVRKNRPAPDKFRLANSPIIS
jgi:hypothetical protein